MNIKEATQVLKDFSSSERDRLNQLSELKKVKEAIHLLAVYVDRINELPGIDSIIKERIRQVGELGFDYTNDALYANEELARAGATYAIAQDLRKEWLDSGHGIIPDHWIPKWWPWDESYWKPTPEDRIKELAKAGALIAAQIDYILNDSKEKSLSTKLLERYGNRKEFLKLEEDLSKLNNKEIDNDIYKIVEEGDPNFYFIKNEKTWLFRIQVNGELTIQEQKERIELMINKLNDHLIINK